MDRRLLILALGMFAMGTDNFVVAGILPEVARSLHTSTSHAGQLVTVYALSYALLAPVIAAVAGTWPRKRLLLAALGVFAAGNVISATATDLNVVLFSRALAGLGAAMFSPTALGTAALLVPAQQRGRALAVVAAGLTGATALGAPLGTFIGGFGGWRSTFWFVALLGLLAMGALTILLGNVPQPAPISLRARLQPLRDRRVVLTLLTSMFAFGGFLMVYTYAGAVLARVTGGSQRELAGLLLVWGIAATAGNLAAGRLVDRFGSPRMIVAGLVIGIVNFAALPWTAVTWLASGVALAIWGFVGWGLLVPLQHRLVQMAPQTAPLLLGLNNSATYAGLACSGSAGGLFLLFLDPRLLSLGGAALIALALLAFAAGAAPAKSPPAPFMPKLEERNDDVATLEKK